jgi:hypothetical protein
LGRIFGSSRVHLPCDSSAAALFMKFLVDAEHADIFYKLEKQDWKKSNEEMRKNICSMQNSAHNKT